ncbi:MAG: T9SS type A sorting domain-containing protein [Bacteroidales bacterium]|nr:T9SS type A sorting domain-containing protein [Bacteroidales bacterium]
MKKILLVLITLTSANLMAQNWCPILVNHKMNYQHSDSSYISHTIWIDSTSISTGDSVFYFNSIVTNHPTNPQMVLRNQPQFFLKQMRKFSEGSYVFSYPGEMLIKSWAGVADPWYFDIENGIMAGISSIEIQDIFGVQDSVKIILLSTLQEIWLSKNFGILKFPDFENEGYYELVGIQNTDYGESVPDFWDIFDFEVGDVFQYSENIFDVYGEGWITEKITITSKEILEDTITYDYTGIYYVFWIEYSPKGDTGYYISGTKTFVNSDNHTANHFHRQIEQLQDWGSGFGTERYFTFTCISKDTNTNLISKKFGLDYYDLYNFNGNAFYELNFESDTLYRYEQIYIIGVPCGLKGYGYGETLGNVFKIDGCFEYWDNMNLDGYIKDGDTVGTITPDSVLLTNISQSKSIKNNWKVYPNPANEILNFKQSNPNITYNIELRNLYGQLVKEEKNIQSPHYAMNVADLKAGVYFYVIKEGDNVLQKGKVVVK